MSSYLARLRRRLRPDTIRLGKAGEEIALALLRRKWCRILERNFSCPLGEVDIVAEDHGTLVFVEVKTRRSVSYAFPEEAVDHKKRKRIINIAEFYMELRKFNNVPVRFDIVAVYYRDVGRSPHIEHFEDAFGADGTI